MRHEVHTEIDIDATPDVVWQILTDLDHYPDWNPFIVASHGSPVVGTTLTNRLQPPGGRRLTFRPTVTEADPGTSFEWLGRLLLPGLLDGRHRFELRSNTTGGTTLVHRERFRGLLVRLVRSSLDTATKAGFEAMNAALKARAESHASVSS